MHSFWYGRMSRHHLHHNLGNFKWKAILCKYVIYSYQLTPTKCNTTGIFCGYFFIIMLSKRHLNKITLDVLKCADKKFACRILWVHLVFQLWLQCLEPQSVRHVLLNHLCVCVSVCMRVSLWLLWLWRWWWWGWGWIVEVTRSRSYADEIAKYTFSRATDLDQHWLKLWLKNSTFPWHSSVGTIIRGSEDTIHFNKVENYIFKITPRSLRD